MLQKYFPSEEATLAGIMLLPANVAEIELFVSLDFSPCQLVSGYSEHVSILLTLHFYALKKF